MKTSLTAGLDVERKKEVEANFKASALFRETLEKHLRSKIETARKTTRTKEAYADSSWAFRQADGIGYERALFDVISLLSSKSVEEQ